jgi:FKBP-type peptidyl-prolyl cis-trans isomerase FkpA
MRKSILAALAVFLAACGSGKTPTPAQAGVSSLEVVDLQGGAGPSIAAGQTAVVNYTGWLYDAAAPRQLGTQFDSSLSTGAPFKFKLGLGEVIKGWDQGVLGMKVGGSRRLTIPAALAYGDNGAGGVIPPGATLVFEVELLGIE